MYNDFLGGLWNKIHIVRLNSTVSDSVSQIGGWEFAFLMFSCDTDAAVPGPHFWELPIV